MDYDLVILRYGEIGLKSSKVRSRFEKKLVKNIKASIDCEVDRNQGRIYLFPKDFEECLSKLFKHKSIKLFIAFRNIFSFRFNILLSIIKSYLLSFISI